MHLTDDENNAQFLQIAICTTLLGQGYTLKLQSGTKTITVRKYVLKRATTMQYWCTFDIERWR